MLNKNNVSPCSRCTICGVQKVPSKLPNKSSKKLLTQAFSRHIIGVASEQKKCTEAKNEQKQTFEQKTPQETTVPRRRSFLFTIVMHKQPTKIPDNVMSGAFVGGAGGYCPRVQMVTYYSSTNIVYSRFYNALRI